MRLLTFVMLSLISSVSFAVPRIELLGQPCHAKNIRSGCILTDRNDGCERLVLCNTNEGSGGELVFVDFERNTSAVFKSPAGEAMVASTEIPGDRLVAVTTHNCNFLVFDLKAMEFSKVVPFPQQYFWDLALGGDGRVYSGTYNGGNLVALDPNTFETEDLGNPVPPNLYCRNLSTLPNGRLFCRFIAEKTTNLIFDPVTKKFEPAPVHLKDVVEGVAWNDYFLVGDKAYQVEDLHTVPPPFPAPSGKGKWSANITATTPDLLVLQHGNVIYTYRNGDKALTLHADVGLRGGFLIGMNKKGELLGVRGQDYFVLKRGDKTLDLRPIPGESSPRPTWFLQVDDKDRLWGGPQIGQTLFYLDTHTGKAVNTPAISDTLGEVYDAAFKDGKTYAASYIGGEIICYDPEKPWDQYNNKNPKLVAKLYGRGYIRPIGGIKLGPDGMLYAGWQAHYGRYGGAISITDTSTGKTDLIENPLGEQAVSSLAVDSRYIYFGTWLAGNGLPMKTGEFPGFGVIDLKTRKVVYRRSSAHGSVRVLGCDGQTGRAVVQIGKRTMIFDSKKWAFLDNIPQDIPIPTSRRAGSVYDGCIYYGSGTSIVKLDMRTGAWNTIADTEKDIHYITVGKGGTIYFNSGLDLYAVR